MVKTLAEKQRKRASIWDGGPAAMKILKAGNRVDWRGGRARWRGDRIPAKAVFVASGGYANSKEWIKKYAGFDLEVNVFPVGNVDKTGDGIRMAWEAGAGETGIEVLELFRVGPVGPGHEPQTPVEYAGVQPELWVDTDGRRFCDETIGFYETSVGNASVKLAEILDENPEGGAIPAHQAY